MQDPAAPAAADWGADRGIVGGFRRRRFRRLTPCADAGLGILRTRDQTVRATRRTRRRRGRLPAGSQAIGAACRLPPGRAVEDSPAPGRARFDRFVAATELPIAALALAVAPALVVEGHARTAAVRDIAHAINWIIWLAFCAEYAVKAALTPD